MDDEYTALIANGT
jgi:hypothetical protein